MKHDPQNLVILCEDSGKITLQAASWGDGGEILRGVLALSKVALNLLG